VTKHVWLGGSHLLWSALVHRSDSVWTEDITSILDEKFLDLGVKGNKIFNSLICVYLGKTPFSINNYTMFYKLHIL
jgi:hypothetical protein